MSEASIEIVAPAGTPAALRAAVDAGADAVYAGFRDETNARNFPGLNFSREEMAEAIGYTHTRGRKLFLAYAMARRTGNFQAVRKTAIDPATKDLYSKALNNARGLLSPELKFAASFLTWPVIGFGGAVVGAWLGLAWLAPLGMGGLFCHYWLDGRIWTRRSFQNR